MNIRGDLVSMAKFKIVVCDVKPCQPRGPIVSSVMDDSDSIYIALASGRLVGQLLPSLCSCQRHKNGLNVSGNVSRISQFAIKNTFIILS